MMAELKQILFGKRPWVSVRELGGGLWSVPVSVDGKPVPEDEITPDNIIPKVFSSVREACLFVEEHGGRARLHLANGNVIPVKRYNFIYDATVILKGGKHQVPPAISWRSYGKEGPDEDRGSA